MPLCLDVLLRVKECWLVQAEANQSDIGSSKNEGQEGEGQPALDGCVCAEWLVYEEDMSTSGPSHHLRSAFSSTAS